MIPGITEVNFGAETSASYATLHEATVTLVDMGERTISTQVRIDGDVVPNFDGWGLVFKGEEFVLPSKMPQAVKDNTTRNSLVNLTFRSWVIEELKRYYYFQLPAYESSTAIAEKYQASVRMTLADFVDNFNGVLRYYWPNERIKMLLDETVAETDTTIYLVEIDYLKIWDVLTRFFEIFHQRWVIKAVQNPAYPTETEPFYEIRVGYAPDEMEADEHIFKYGYDGGLLKFERQVQDEDITNVLLGRGGEKNLPARYFKLSETVGSTTLTGDPDAIPELANIYFDKLRDITFRWYVRGWMHNPNRDTSGDEAWDPGHTFPTYNISGDPESPNYSPYYWAYYKGLHDDHFDPVEYVANTFEVGDSGLEASGSIAKYGERWGALEDAEDIYPTIQGKTIDGLGRIDEAVAFSAPTNDKIDDYVEDSAVQESIDEMVAAGAFVDDEYYYDTSFPNKRHLTGTVVESDAFTVPAGKVAVITATWVAKFDPKSYETYGRIKVETSSFEAISVDDGSSAGTSSVASDGARISSLAEGTYKLRLTLDLEIKSGAPTIHLPGTFGLTGITLYLTNVDENAWKPTFDVYVKNLWNTAKIYVSDGQGGTRLETDSEYAERVWLPILGGYKNQDPRVVFSSGPLSISSDYEFAFAGIPAYDTSEVLDGVLSHWRITLRKSDAEYKTTGLFVPNAKTPPEAGDTFFFTGIEIPFYYVIWAEERLSNHKGGQLDLVKDINPTWVATLDKVRINTLPPVDEDEEEEGEGETTPQTIAERLAPGMKIHLQDPRFAADGLALFVQSLTYKWDEPSENSPIIVPDIQVVLSDKVVSQISTVSRLQGQVNTIASDYVRADQVEDAVRRVASALFLKKTGEDDMSKSPTVFSSRVTSENFRQGGVGGSGWGIYKTNSPELTGEGATGDSVVEFDRVIVRKELQVETMVVNQIEARGGKEILSAAKMTVSKVIFDDESGLFNIYFDQKQGSVSNLFVQGDIILCERFTSDWQSSPLKTYRMVVAEAGVDYISVDPNSNDGDGEPEVGDVIVQYGHISNAARQSVIIRDVIGGGYERMITGLGATYNGVSDEWQYWAGKEYFFAGMDSTTQKTKWFVGDRTANQFLEYDGTKLTIKGGVSVGYSDASSTTIEGNLIQTGEILLGQVNNHILSIYAGISGNYNDNIAAWYGGPKVDHEASPSEVSYARSLFRFNGSGYLASGRIKWNPDGTGQIPGVSWTNNAVIIDSDIKFEGANHELIGLIDTVKLLASLFTRVGAGTAANPYRIKALYSLFTEGSITAGTPGSSSGGGGGSAVDWAQILQSGTKIATITIDDDAPIDVYAPAQITESDVSGWGFTKNAGTITGITMNGVSKGTSGVVDLGNVITAHQSVTSENATIGTTLTKIATIGGTEIKAKITHQSLANYVTLNSAQTITAIKTFNEKIIANNGIRLTTGTPLKFLVSDTEYSPLVLNAWINSNKLYFAITPDTSVVTGDATLGSSVDFWKGVYAEDMYAKGFISWKVKGTTQGANDEGVFRFYTRKLVNGSEVWKNSLTVEYDEGLTADGDIKPLNDGTNNLGSSAAFWNKGYIKELRMAEYGTSIFAGGTGDDAILSIWGSAQDHYGDIVIGHYNASARRSLRLTTKDYMYFSVKNADKIVMGANDFRPAANNGLGLGTSSFKWSEIHASKWYPGTAQQAWVELVDGRLTVHGDLVATGNIVAGTPGQNAAEDYVEFTTALNTYSSDDAIATDDSTALTSAITAIQSGSVRRLVDANGWYSIMSVESDSSTYGRIYFMMRGAVMCLYYSNSQSRWYITDDMSN